MRPLVALTLATFAFTALPACSKSSSAPASTCAGGAAYCFTPSSSESDIAAAFASVKDGDLVTFAAGTYKFTNQLALGPASHVTVSGAGASTILDFSGQLVAGDAVFAQSPSTDLTFKNFAIQGSPGNAIKALSVVGLTFDSLTVSWPGGDPHAHGAYGVYPVQCTNVTIQNCKVSGANDSGIYVGQSQNVVVQNNECFQNVAGIEIENTYFADVHDNKSHDNTAGILVFGLPGLQQEGGHGIRVFSNTIANNNTANFAAKGDIVSGVPAGTGFFVMAATNVEVFGNTIQNNGTLAAAVISYFASLLPVGDPQYDAYSESVYLHGNTFTGNGASPDVTNQLGLLLSTGSSGFPGGHTPDVFWDGITSCPIAALSDAGLEGPDGGCGVVPTFVGPSDNPLDICFAEPGASGICDMHLDLFRETPPNLPQIVDCDAGFLGCTLPPLPAVDAG
jgi:parallel beta-helix repeat protein